MKFKTQQDFAKIVKGKKVLLVGPGTTLKKDVDNFKEIFDIFIHFNNHYKYTFSYVPSVDFVVHNMNVNDYSREDLESFKRSNINLICRNELSTSDKNNKKFRTFSQKNKYGIIPFEIPKSFFSSLKKGIGIKPTTGILTLAWILSFDIEYVGLAGFDFYSKNNKYIREAKSIVEGVHYPEKEFEYFKKILNERIKLSKTLEEKCNG
jgi:hypothetical protein